MSTLNKVQDSHIAPVTTKKPDTVAPRAHPVPAAGAHAASHLTNDDATPGSGVLTSRASASGREVDGAAG